MLLTLPVVQIKLLFELVIDRDPHDKTSLLDLIAIVKRANEIKITLYVHEGIRVVRPELNFNLTCLLQLQQRSKVEESGAENHFQLF